MPRCLQPPLCDADLRGVELPGEVRERAEELVTALRLLLSPVIGGRLLNRELLVIFAGMDRRLPPPWCPERWKDFRELARLVQVWAPSHCTLERVELLQAEEWPDFGRYRLTFSVAGARHQVFMEAATNATTVNGTVRVRRRLGPVSSTLPNNRRSRRRGGCPKRQRPAEFAATAAAAAPAAAENCNNIPCHDGAAGGAASNQPPATAGSSAASVSFTAEPEELDFDGVPEPVLTVGVAASLPPVVEPPPPAVEPPQQAQLDFDGVPEPVPTTWMDSPRQPQPQPQPSSAVEPLQEPGEQEGVGAEEQGVPEGPEEPGAPEGERGEAEQSGEGGDEEEGAHIEAAHAHILDAIATLHGAWYSQSAHPSPGGMLTRFLPCIQLEEAPAQLPSTTLQLVRTYVAANRAAPLRHSVTSPELAVLAAAAGVRQQESQVVRADAAPNALLAPSRFPTLCSMLEAAVIHRPSPQHRLHQVCCAADSNGWLLTYFSPLHGVALVAPCARHVCTRPACPIAAMEAAARDADLESHLAPLRVQQRTLESLLGSANRAASV